MMMNICWHKYPDEKPCDTSDESIIIVINEPFNKPYTLMCGYNEREHYFFEYRLHTDGEYDEADISDEYITHWIYVDEIPLPKE
ncbi:MAG: hypothetical protein J6583_07680 [Gilliamella sp.]|nr:hypothetical protein [Gilliamella sp.]